MNGSVRRGFVGTLASHAGSKIGSGTVMRTRILRWSTRYAVSRVEPKLQDPCKASASAAGFTPGAAHPGICPGVRPSRSGVILRDHVAATKADFDRVDVGAILAHA